MLVTLHLWGTLASQAPLLHLRRGRDDGLFDQFAEHFEAVWHNASHPDPPNPQLYPSPTQHPDRYAPMTQTRFAPEELPSPPSPHPPA